MKITGWVNTSTIVLEFDVREIWENQIPAAGGGYNLFPVRLTIVWTHNPARDWSPASWTVEASRRTGDLVTLTETDVIPAPAWVTRAIDEYHPSNYEG